LRVEFIKNNIFLILVAFVSGAMLLWPLVQRRTGGPWVNTLEATQLINRSDAVVVDAREPAEYGRGHSLGAKNIPLGELEKRAAELAKYKARPLIVHCDTDGRTSSALAILRKHGIANAVNLAGGYAAWQQAGLPVEK
jgi:rhodanese-related sulfurtransferase